VVPTVSLSRQGPEPTCTPPWRGCSYMYALSNKSSWAGYFPPSVLGKTCAAAGLVRGEGQMAPKAPKTPSRGLVAGGRTPLTQHSARAPCARSAGQEDTRASMEVATHQTRDQQPFAQVGGRRWKKNRRRRTHPSIHACHGAAASKTAFSPQGDADPALLSDAMQQLAKVALLLITPRLPCHRAHINTELLGEGQRGRRWLNTYSSLMAQRVPRCDVERISRKGAGL